MWQHKGAGGFNYLARFLFQWSLALCFLLLRKKAIKEQNSARTLCLDKIHSIIHHSKNLKVEKVENLQNKYVNFLEPPIMRGPLNFIIKTIQQGVLYFMQPRHRLYMHCLKRVAEWQQFSYVRYECVRIT